MTNVAMNNKAGVIGGVAAMLIITLSIPSGETILYVFARVSETFMGVFVAILVNYDINHIRLFLEKKRKIMLYFITLLIDVCLFLDYNRQKEGNCNEGKKNFAEIWLFFPIGQCYEVDRSIGASDSYYEDQELIKPDRNEETVACIP